MNLSYHLVWSAVHRAWIVVSELVKSNVKSSTVVAAFATTTLATQTYAAECVPEGRPNSTSNAVLEAGSNDTDVTLVEEQIASSNCDYIAPDTMMGIGARNNGSILRFEEGGTFNVSTIR
ncbi:MAG: ESPR domain-containing protein [Neisseriaceae bacterium]|nr:ESPR domain-containing protein [Neisseriaceae bacterium]